MHCVVSLIVIVAVRTVKSINFMRVCVSHFTAVFLCSCSFLTPLVWFVCVFCVGAVSNRGRHDRVGKARERAGGKGATCQAHPAGTRRPGAGHRTQQIWTLLSAWFPSTTGLAQLATHQSKNGECTGLIQQHPLTPPRDFLRINPPWYRSTPPLPPPPDCVHCGVAGMRWTLVWYWRAKMVRRF